MNLGINTITKRLFFSFGMLVFTIVLIAVLSLLFINRIRTINDVTHEIDNQRILIIQLIKTDLDFLKFETLNEEFYKTSSSPLLVYRDSVSNQIRERNKALYTIMASHDFLIDYEFHTINSTLEKYDSTFRLLIHKINERGFKDFGLEGQMRDYAHRLENTPSSISLTALLMLRRHEKDFLLRKENVYIRHFNELAKTIHGKLKEKNHTQALHILTRYQEAFNKLTVLNVEIGIAPTDGLLGQLNAQTNLISAGLQQLTLLSNERSQEVIKESVILFLIISILTFLLSMILTYYTSTRLARPIKKLSNTIGKFMIHEGLDEKDLENADITNEISNLSQSFFKLSRKLKAQFEEIQQKSALLEKQNYELKKLNEELDRFIYSAAHDLKSPLASLDGLVRLAKIEINSPENGHYFSMMHDSVRKLNGFIRDITDYAKNKRQQLRVERVSLNTMIEEIIGGLMFLPHAGLLDIQIWIKEGEIYTDRTRLEIILKNLLSNAFRYMDFSKGHPFIKIEADVHEQAIMMRITDNGIGIEAEHIPKIFQMFYRAVEHSQGTGIGLFLVKESLKMLRGTIAVQSRHGEGTIFSLNIPNFKSGHVNMPESEAIVLNEAV